MRSFLDMIKKILKENLISVIIISIIILVAIITPICYYNIPRLSYEYSEELDGYLVDKAFGNKEEYLIPKSHKDKPVIGIGERAFFRHSRLKKITLEAPEEITIIKKLAFSECPRLEEINLEHVLYIERSAFSYDTSLNNLTIGAKKIGASAFYKCSALNSVTLLEGMESIGSMAFSNTAISDIILPRSVTHVYNDCFIYAESLKRVVVKNKELLLDDYIKSLGSIVIYEE